MHGLNRVAVAGALVDAVGADDGSAAAAVTSTAGRPPRRPPVRRWHDCPCLMDTAGVMAECGRWRLLAGRARKPWLRRADGFGRAAVGGYKREGVQHRVIRLIT